MDESLKDRGNALELMFRIIYCKFQQNRHLAYRLLYDTSDKPIWHVDSDGFWGTDQMVDRCGTTLRSGSRSGRTGSEEKKSEWYAGDNWNGKILAVVRELLKQEITLNTEVCMFFTSSIITSCTHTIFSAVDNQDPSRDVDCQEIFSVSTTENLNVN
jgi:hypothetical protein